MPGLLEGQLATALFNGFKGKLSKAVLWRAVGATSGGLDQLGDEIAVEPVTYPAEGFTDEYSDAFRERAGIPLTDLKVCLFAKSLPASIQPLKDDKAEVPKDSGNWFQLRKAATDPATALWTCQAFRCDPPEEN